MARDSDERFTSRVPLVLPLADVVMFPNLERYFRDEQFQALVAETDAARDVATDGSLALALTDQWWPLTMNRDALLSGIEGAVRLGTAVCVVEDRRFGLRADQTVGDVAEVLSILYTNIMQIEIADDPEWTWRSRMGFAIRAGYYDRG